MKKNIESRLTKEQYQKLISAVSKQMRIDLELAEYNRLLELLKDVPTDKLQEYLPSNIFCHDIDGNILSVGDSVVVLDVEDLDEKPLRGEVLVVSRIEDAESNYVRFDHDTAFFGHRVLKLKFL